MTAADYRIAHGLPRGRGLVATALSQQLSERSRARIGTRQWQQFTAARDPIQASHARETPGVFQAPAAMRARSNTSARTGHATRRAAVRTCPVCSAQWCPLPGGYGRRTCGATTCRRAATATSLRQQRATMPTLTHEQRTALAALRGDALHREVARLKTEGISQRDMGDALGISNAAMSRLMHGTIPASLR